jgi:RNA polymerase sigma-70 factor (ECF subfamily)
MYTQTAVDPELYRMAQDCPEGLTDEEIMRVLCGSNPPQGESLGETLFSELFSRYHVRVTLWCLRFTRDRSRALDLTQEAFFRAYRHRHSFRGDSRFSTWLYAITRNQCLSSVRRAADPADGGELLPSRMRDLSVTPPDIAIERKQRHREILQVMDTALQPTEARVMALHFGYELPLADITQQLALTNKSGAKAYVISARRKLDRLIKRRNAAAKASPVSRSAA